MEGQPDVAELSKVDFAMIAFKHAIVIILVNRTGDLTIDETVQWADEHFYFQKQLVLRKESNSIVCNYFIHFIENPNLHEQHTVGLYLHCYLTIRKNYCHSLFVLFISL